MQGPLCAGQVFLAANPQSERLTDVLDAVVRVSGAKGYKAKKAESRMYTSLPIVSISAPFWEGAFYNRSREAYDTAWVSTLQARPSLAAALTGWQPKKMGLVDGMDVYWASYLASRRDGGKLRDYLAKL